MYSGCNYAFRRAACVESSCLLLQPTSYRDNGQCSYDILAAGLSSGEQEPAGHWQLISMAGQKQRRFIPHIPRYNLLSSYGGEPHNAAIPRESQSGHELHHARDGGICPLHHVGCRDWYSCSSRSLGLHWFISSSALVPRDMINLHPALMIGCAQPEQRSHRRSTEPGGP